VAHGKPTLSNKIPARVGPINAPKSKVIYEGVLTRKPFEDREFQFV
jgi:hypothetical protein